MPRNRTIWPEFWGDVKLASVSRDARLLFIGMWNFADDYGVIKGNPDWIRSNVFEEDENITTANVKKWIGELVAVKVILPFTGSDQKSYLFIKNWSKYQRVDKPSKRRNPKPPDGLDSSPRDSSESPDVGSSNLQSPIGNLKDPSNMSGKPDVSPPKDSLKTQAVEVLVFLNEKAGRNYRQVDTNVDLVKARLKSGVTVQDCKAVIARKCREWKGDDKMDEYLRPKTLFNKTNFEQYLGECGKGEQGGVS